MIKKHAYLVIAHEDITLLQLLLSLLDDERNDIYLHIDKKVNSDTWNLQVKKSRLYILKNRVDVRWGHISIVEAEYRLFESAFSIGGYNYYHILSGADLPIKSQDYIHEFCSIYQGKEFIGFCNSQNIEEELRSKVGIFHLFSRDFKTKSMMKRFLRSFTKKIQMKLGVNRNKKVVFKKGPQWCSVTEDFVAFLLSKKTEVLKMYKYTYCPDEIFIQTLCWNSIFMNKVYDYSNEFIGCQRYIPWNNGHLESLTKQDLQNMKKTKKWFARKFSSKDIELMSSYRTIFNNI